MSKRIARSVGGPSAGLSLIQGQNFAITEAGWQSLIKAAKAARPPKNATALTLTQDEYPDEAPIGCSVCEGVATIRVRGPLIMDENWLWRYFGWSTYEGIARAYGWALNDASVQAIVFDFDSPGGGVSGVSELAALLYANRETKPQYAFVSGMCCSAALWFCAAIGYVAASDVALMGSIGAMFSYLDTTKYERTIGIQEKSVISKQTPRKNADPTTPEGRSELQTVADDLADVFIDALALYRGVSRATVLADFGKGAFMVAAKAVDAGLADEVTTEAELIEDLLAELANPASVSATLPAVDVGGRASTATTSEADMKTPRAGTARAGRRSAPSGTAAAGTTDEQDTDAKAKAEAKAKSKAKPKADDEGEDASADDENDEAEAAAKDADDEEDEQDGGADEDEEDDQDDEKKKPSGKGKAKASADDRATLIAQAKAEERERVAKIRALKGSAEVLDACVNDPDCTPEAAAYRILTGETGAKPKAKNRLADLRADDAGQHPSATAPKPQPTTPREAARASVDRYYANTRPAVKAGATTRTS